MSGHVVGLQAVNSFRDTQRVSIKVEAHNRHVPSRQLDSAYARTCLWRFCKLIQRASESLVGIASKSPRFGVHTNSRWWSDNVFPCEKPKRVAILCLLTQISPVRIDGVG